MTLESYLRRRRAYEIGLFSLMFAVNFVAQVNVVWIDLEKAGLDIPRWQPVVWEGTSTIAIAAMLLVLLWFDSHFRLERGHARRSVVAHMLFTVPWSLGHVAIMVLLRKVAYSIEGGHYDFGDVPYELFYEYLKDFRAYWGFVALIYLYRHILLRLQGEAQFLAEGEEDEPQRALPVTDRFLVKKLGREFLVKVEDIDWVEAAGNYVNLRVGQRAYPLRETMNGIEARLAGAGFVRVHRSAIVNLDRIAEIVPFDTGDGEIRLKGDARVPVSRRFRKELRDRIG